MTRAPHYEANQQALERRAHRDAIKLAQDRKTWRHIDRGLAFVVRRALRALRGGAS